MYPVYFPEAPAKCTEILAAEASIVAEEGFNTVRGRYYARDYDASFWRALEAERIVRAGERAKRLSLSQAD